MNLDVALSQLACGLVPCQPPLTDLERSELVRRGDARWVGDAIVVTEQGRRKVLELAKAGIKARSRSL